MEETLDTVTWWGYHPFYNIGLPFPFVQGHHDCDLNVLISNVVLLLLNTIGIM